jgi:DNA-binding MarR family transcriptional regulator
MTAALQQELRKQHPFETPEQEAYLNLIRTCQHLVAFEDRFMRQYGLSGPKYNVLRILRGIGGEGAPCSVIRERMVTRVPDITRLIDRLERDGLVTRHRVERDRRVVLVRPSKKALELLIKMDDPLLELHREQLGHMSRKDLASLSQLLERARQTAPVAEVPITARKET